MTIQSINPTSVLLSLSREELQERGLRPDLLTRQQTEELARECLFALGRNDDSVLELESYPGEDHLLLFIHTTPAVWRFPDGDTLLDAMAVFPELTGLSLYWWQNAFWLVGKGSDALSEFAEPIRDDPLLGARLAEYAQPLF